MGERTKTRKKPLVYIRSRFEQKAKGRNMYVGFVVL